jgi:hypothetical protein
MNNFKLTITAFLFVLGTVAYAQYNIDFGVKLGASNYLGDIGGQEKTRRGFVMDMKLKETNLTAGIYGRYKINGTFGVQASLNIGKISGDDAQSSNVGRNTRNLRFKNNVVEFSTRGEVYIFELNDVGGHGRYWVDMKAYGFTGFTAFHHNPKGRLSNGTEWYKLQPLQTEGVAYSQWGFGVPAGLGLYFTYKRKHRFGMEMCWTTTFTDYLDDISSVYADPATLGSDLARELANQSALVTDDVALLSNYAPPSENNMGKRGDPTHNDTYLFTTLSYGYVLRGKSNFYSQNYGWLSGRKKTVRKVRAKF